MLKGSKMKLRAFAIMIALVMVMSTFSSVRADASLTIIGGDIINGNQMNPNNFGVAGTIDGLAAGNYFIAFIRTPHNFTTQNLQAGVSGVFWTNFGSPHSQFINSGPHAFALSGIIPYGVECAEYEQIEIVVRNSAAQVVLSKIIKILNPTHQAPLPNFKINGNGAISPSAIVINNSTTPNITLNYTGTGTVTSYRLYLSKASANGVPISGSGSAGSDASWHNGAVPTSINIRSLAGGSFVLNQLTIHPGYYLITLETQGGVCAYVGSAPHNALIMTKNTIVIYDNNTHREN